MKILSVLLAATLVAQASPGEPGKVAVEFLEKVREHKLNLEPGGDTALSAQTAPRKRRQIAKRLERLADDLGTDTLEIGDVKLDDDLAAVMVRKSGGFDPGSLRVFPVALVRRDSEWEPAPLPASFENSGTGYAIALRNRIEQLENWMLRQQVVDLENLQSLALGRMRDHIETKLTAPQLAKLDVRQIGDRFLSACADGDLPTVLGLIGGLGEPLPADWSMRLRAAENAFQSVLSAPRPWSLLVAPQVARVLVHHEEDERSGQFSIGFLDPGGIGRTPPRIELVHFSLTKSAAGLWRINPPPEFLATSASDDHEDTPLDPDNHPDRELIEKFPAAWAATHPPTPQATAELASHAWFAALGSGNFPNFLSTADLTGDPAEATRSCVGAARAWWEVRGPTAAAIALPLADHAEADAAVCIYQTLTPRDPGLLDLQTLFLTKSAAGWHWQPNPTEAARERFAPWLEPEMNRLPDAWESQLLAPCPVVAKDQPLTAPATEFP